VKRVIRRNPHSTRKTRRGLFDLGEKKTTWARSVEKGVELEGCPQRGSTVGVNPQNSVDVERKKGYRGGSGKGVSSKKVMEEQTQADQSSPNQRL